MKTKQRVIALIQRILGRFGYQMRRLKPAPLPVEASNVLALAISDVLWRNLQQGRNPSEFRFVQIGANDGVSLDPIRRFVTKYGFRGVLVEPQPEAFARLQQNYAGMPGIACEQAAIAARDGQAEMYRFKQGPGVPEWAGCLATFSKERLLNNFHNVRGEVETVVVPTLTVASLAQKHQLSSIDLLQIDTEGFDYELLKLIDFSSIRPKIIQFEHGLLSETDQNECFQFLNRQGYKVNNNGSGDTVAYLEPPEQALFRIDVQAEGHAQSSADAPTVSGGAAGESQRQLQTGMSSPDLARRNH